MLVCIKGLLFSALMDVVSSEARSGLLGKGLKVNAGMSKVMVGSSGWKQWWEKSTLESGPVVSGKGVQANSVQYTVCKKKLSTSGTVVCVVTCCR